MTPLAKNLLEMERTVLDYSHTPPKSLTARDGKRFNELVAAWARLAHIKALAGNLRSCLTPPPKDDDDYKRRAMRNAHDLDSHIDNMKLFQKQNAALIKSLELKGPDEIRQYLADLKAEENGLWAKVRPDLYGQGERLQAAAL